MVKVEIEEIPPKRIPPIRAIDFVGGEGIVIRGEGAFEGFGTGRAPRGVDVGALQRQQSQQRSQLQSQRLKDLRQEQLRLTKEARERFLKDIRGLSRNEQLQRRLQFAGEVGSISLQTQDLRGRINVSTIGQLRSAGFKILPTRQAPSQLRERQPKAITAFRPITREEQRAERVRLIRERVTRPFRRLEERFPARPGGLIEFTGLDKPGKRPRPLIAETERVKVIEREFGAVRGATVILDTREKTFFEKAGINPNDPSSLQLKNRVDDIQFNFNAGSITEEKANKQLEQASDTFTKAQIKKGIPKDAALGVAFGLIASVPIVGQVAAGLLFTDLFLKRRAVAQQFKKFPVESSISTAAFLAGGLAGAATVRGVRSRVTPELNLENIQSVTKLSGKDKIKLTSAAVEFDNNFRISQNKAKISDTLAYEVVLSDGKRFKVLEFSKLDRPAGTKGVKGTREFIGFEVSPKIQARIGGRARPVPREVLFGRAAQVITSEGGETFLRVLRFRPRPTPLGRLAQRLFGGGKVFDIVERSKVVGTRGRFNRITQIESQARLLSVKRIEANLLRKIITVEKKITEGKKLSFGEVKNLINLERRLGGKQPFTELEFRRSGFRTIADITTVSLFSLFKRVRQRARLKEGVTVKLRETIGGVIRARPIPTPKPRDVSRLTRIRERRPAATISQVRERINALARDSVETGKARNLLNKQQLKQVIGKIRQIPSSGIALAVSLVKRQPTQTAMVGLRTSIATISLSASLSALAQLENQLTLQAQRQRSLILQGTPVLTGQRTNQLQQVRQALALRLKQLQLQKLKLIQSGRSFSRSGVSPRATPRLRVPPPFLTVARGGGKPFGLPLLPKQQGYHAFFKGVKQKTFTRITKQPTTKARARDAMAFLVDKSLSATGAIRRAKRNAKRLKLPIPKDYFQRTRAKFRPFKIKKGTKIPTPFQWIERRRFRLDSASEVRRITGFKKLAQLRRKSKAPKLKSTRLIRVKRR